MNGMWTSTDSGTTWTQVSAANAPPMSSNGTGSGIAFIAFYKPSLGSGRTQTIFAGLSSSTAPSSLYKSTDAGAHWSPVSGGPGATATSGMYPNHGLIGPDGNLYMTYSGGNGPANIWNGQVWRYNIGSNTWQNITPLAPTSSDGFTYAGLALDPQHPGTLIVSTTNRYTFGDTIFRSTNSGNAGSWVNLKAKAQFSWTQQPWGPWGSPNVFPNWMNPVIDPFNSNNAFFGTGGGIFRTTNLTNADSGLATNWSAAAKGIEELVPQSIASPISGAPLIAAVADACGFVVSSLTTPPSSMISTTSGTGVAAACSFGASIDWAKGNPSRLVMVGSNRNDPKPLGVISTNGGSTWTTFPSVPAGMTYGEGSAAISYDGNTIVWSSHPVDNLAPAYTTNGGASWTTISFWGSTLPVGSKMLSDGGQNLFYAWKPDSTNFYVGNATGGWYQSSTALPVKPTLISTVPGRGGEVWMAANSGLYKSTNSGTSWSAPITISWWGSTFSPNSVGFGKAASGASYPAIYAGGRFNDGTTGLMRSIDGGTTWVKLNDGNHQWGGISQVVGDMRTFGTVYFSSSIGVGRGIFYGTSSN